MDILAMIASAVGGIVLWNLLFSSKKQAKCEAATGTASYVGTTRVSDQHIANNIERAFGTADLDYVIRVSKAYAGTTRISDQHIAHNIERAFGTADLDYVLKTFAPMTRKRLIEAQQKSGPSR